VYLSVCQEVNYVYRSVKKLSVHQTEDEFLEVGEDKGSESELCPRALKKVLHTGCHGEFFFL
jgi:hypothetical protein